MLLFAAHDPGARNHVRPVFEHALKLGQPAEFLDLSQQSQLLDPDEALRLIKALMPLVLITGISMNQAEWPLVRACRSLSVKSAMMVDIGAEVKLDGVVPADFPDRFMVTNQGCYQEMLGYGALPVTLVLTGSAHLERLSKTEPPSADSGVREFYGLGSDHNLISFFCSPDTDAAIAAISSLAALLPKSPIRSPAVVVRPHPRAEAKHRLASLCGRFEFLRYDGGDHIPTLQLLTASTCSLSMESTVTLESLVLGIPSALYQIGWDFRQPGNLRNVDIVPRIRNLDQLIEFVRSVLDKECVFIPDEIEHYEGALGRIWQVISELRDAA